MAEEEEIAEVVTPETTPAAESDPQRQLAEAQAQLERLNKDLEKVKLERQSALGQIKRQENWVTELERIRRHQTHLEEKTDLILEVSLKGETEGVVSKLDTLKSRRQAEEQQSGVQQEANRIYEDIQEEIVDCGLDPSKPHELFGGVASRFNEAVKQGAEGLPLLRDALRQAKQIRRAFLKKQDESRKEQVMREAESKAKEINRRAGVYNTESPPAVGSSSSTPLSRKDLAELDIRDKSVKELREMADRVSKQLKR